MRVQLAHDRRDEGELHDAAHFSMLARRGASDTPADRQIGRDSSLVQRRRSRFVIDQLHSSSMVLLLGSTEKSTGTPVRGSKVTR